MFTLQAQELWTGQAEACWLDIMMSKLLKNVIATLSCLMMLDWGFLCERLIAQYFHNSNGSNDDV